MEEQESKTQVLYYLSIDTPLGIYDGMNDEATEEELTALADAILNQELCILKLEVSETQTVFFCEETVKNSIISICRVNSSKPF